MKKTLAIAALLACSSTGCLAAELGDINTAADNQRAQLDAACKPAFSTRTDEAYLVYSVNLSRWCATQYQLVEADRETQSVAAVQNAQIRANAFQHMADGFRRR